MKNKNNLIYYLVFTFAAILFSILMAMFYFSLYDVETETLMLVLSVALAVLSVCVGVFLSIYVNVLKKKENSFTYSLEKLIRYNKKRQEIEQEISALTNELTQSDVSQYLDVNRLLFASQSETINTEAINYDNFLNQFGIRSEEINIKRNSAIFLTPFNSQGEEAFLLCRDVLGKLDVFLQKTDNPVHKDDIMMNIVTSIVRSELVIANIDGRNPNVYYELGIAHALGKPTILISRSNFSEEEIGFDIRQKRIIIYKNKDDLEKQLLYQINRLKNK